MEWHKPHICGEMEKPEKSLLKNKIPSDGRGEKCY